MLIFEQCVLAGVDAGASSRLSSSRRTQSISSKTSRLKLRMASRLPTSSSLRPVTSRRACKRPTTRLKADWRRSSGLSSTSRTGFTLLRRWALTSKVDGLARTRKRESKEGSIGRLWALTLVQSPNEMFGGPRWEGDGALGRCFRTSAWSWSVNVWWALVDLFRFNKNGGVESWIPRGVRDGDVSMGCARGSDGWMERL